MRQSFLRRAVGIALCLVSGPATADRVGFNGCATSATFAYYNRGEATNFNFQIVAKGANQQTVLISFVEGISDPALSVTGNAPNQIFDMTFPTKYITSILPTAPRDRLLIVDIDYSQGAGSQSLKYLRIGDTGAPGCP